MRKLVKVPRNSWSGGRHGRDLTIAHQIDGALIAYSTVAVRSFRGSPSLHWPVAEVVKRPLCLEDRSLILFDFL